jgi:hypothetical protein
MRHIDGELVVNATVRVRVQVTKADIEKGTPMDQNSCAIAVACRRQLAGVTDVYVHRGRAYLLRNGKWLRLCVPRYARDEIVAFDRGGKFVPQEIELLPPPVETIGRHSKLRGRPVRSKGGRRRVMHHTPELRDTAHKDLPEGR